MDRSKQLAEGSIPSLLLKFSAPAIVGTLSQALYNVVDRIFIGQAVGPLGITGTTVSFPLMLVLTAFSTLIGYGAASLVSLRLGQQNKPEAEHVLGQAVVLLGGASVLLTCVGLWLLDPLLQVFGASPASLPYARQYLQIIVAGCTFQIVGFGLNAVVRGEGNPRVAMVTLLIGGFLNVLLNPLFLFGFGWGMRGSAAATVTSQAVSCVWVVSYFLRGSSLLALHADNLKLSWRMCKSIINIGSPTFAMQMAASLVNVLLNNQLRVHGGDLAISIMGIVHAVAIFIAMPVLGLNQGVQPIIGYNYGAHKFDRVKKTLQTAIVFATAICVGGFVVVMVFPTQVIWLFHRQDALLLQEGGHAIRICLMMFPIIGFQMVSSSYFQAVGRPRQSLILGLSRQVLLLIPAILILPRFFGLDGIWAALPTADLGSSVLTGTCLLFELRHLRDRHVNTGLQQVEPMADGEIG